MRWYMGYTGTDLVSDRFTNNDIIETAFGANLTIEMPPDVVHAFMVNSGLMIATFGASLTLEGPRSMGFQLSTLHNAGALEAWAGTLNIQTNVDGGLVEAINGGVINDYGSMANGTMILCSGTLAFHQLGVTSRQGPGGPNTAQMLRDTMLLAGRDVIDYGRSDISVAYDAAKNNLSVLVPWTGHGQTVISSIQLTGVYAAAEFSVQGNSVVFTQG